MTMLYLYAVTDRPELPLPDRAGPDGVSGLHRLVYREIAAVVSGIATVSVSPTEANLWQHEGVVEALMEDRSVLPVRFGTVLADEAAARTVLSSHYGDFVDSLVWVRDRVEIGLHVLWEDIDQTLPTSHRPAVTRIPQRAETLAGELDRPLARLSVESTYQVLTTPRMLLTAAYLIDRDRVAAFRQAVKDLAMNSPDLRFLCTGPWPPYSFVALRAMTDLNG
jgi:hypothetical protein